MTPLIDAFESTFELTDHYKRRHQEALSKKCSFYHFSLYDKNKPVSSLTMSLNKNIARIHDIGTLPAYQGKGYATELMKIDDFGNDIVPYQVYLWIFEGAGTKYCSDFSEF